MIRPTAAQNLKKIQNSNERDNIFYSRTKFNYKRKSLNQQRFSNCPLLVCVSIQSEIHNASRIGTNGFQGLIHPESNICKLKISHDE
jgi:hypothetical protein